MLAYTEDRCRERGSSALGIMSRSREHGFESPFLYFRSLIIFILFTMPQLTTDDGGNVSEYCIVFVQCD